MTDEVHIASLVVHVDPRSLSGVEQGLQGECQNFCVRGTLNLH